MLKLQSEGKSSVVTATAITNDNSGVLFVSRLIVFINRLQKTLELRKNPGSGLPLKPNACYL